MIASVVVAFFALCAATAAAAADTSVTQALQLDGTPVDADVPYQLTRRLYVPGAARIDTRALALPQSFPVVTFDIGSCAAAQCRDDGTLPVTVRVDSSTHGAGSGSDGATSQAPGAAHTPWQLRGDVVAVTVEGGSGSTWMFDVFPTPTTRGTTFLAPLTADGVASVEVPCRPRQFVRLSAFHRGGFAQAHVWTAPDTRQVPRALVASVQARRDDLDRTAGALASKEEAVAWQYDPLHPSLRRLNPAEHVHPDLRAAVESGDVNRMWRLLTPVYGSAPADTAPGAAVPGAVPVTPGNHPSDAAPPRVFTLPVFTDAFTSMLVEELRHSQSQTAVNFTRPNSMNNYGAVLSELGLSQTMADVLEVYLKPLMALAFPDWAGATVDSHHAFTIEYETGGDTTLDRHMDDSEVTLNVCIGGTFTGSAVEFNDVRDHGPSADSVIVVDHQPGVGLLHVGQQFHQTKPLERCVCVCACVCVSV